MYTRPPLPARFGRVYSATVASTANLPDHYESLGVTSSATPAEIERAYQSRAAKLRASQVQDAPEELAEVEAAYSVLRYPPKRAQYDLEVCKADHEEDKKCAELDAQLQRNRHHHRKHVDGTSGWLDSIWGPFSNFLGSVARFEEPARSR